MWRRVDAVLLLLLAVDKGCRAEKMTGFGRKVAIEDPETTTPSLSSTVLDHKGLIILIVVLTTLFTVAIIALFVFFFHRQMTRRIAEAKRKNEERRLEAESYRRSLSEEEKTKKREKIARIGPGRSPTYWEMVNAEPASSLSPPTAWIEPPPELGRFQTGFL